MDIDEAVNSSTGLWPRCLYPETDVTLNPSLKGKRMCMIPKKHISPSQIDSVSLFFLWSINNKAEE